jgi:predicted DNA-binding transcriptional regulator YafY
MPANLNALIRYKTINSCLYGGKRRWSIRELIERCSQALAEYRGKYEPVSERTIRDDIRVMRSEILGYNAPIEQQKGLYYYSDPGYSIMTISFTDSALIERIIRFLGEIKHEVSHPELEIILDKLMKLKNKYYWEEKQIDDIESYLESSELTKHEEAEESILKVRRPVKVKASRRIDYRTEEAFKPIAPSMSEPIYPDFINWGDILITLHMFH